MWSDPFGVHGSIILTKTDYFVVAMLSGTNQYNFCEYCTRKNTHPLVLPAMLNWDPGPWTLYSEVEVERSQHAAAPSEVCPARD